MSTSTTKTIAIFGATGGTGLATLTRALAAGLNVNVLARTASKLSSLSEKYPNLNIIQGDIRNVLAIKQALVHNGHIVDIVVSAIGMALRRQGLRFTSDDIHICEEGTRCILQARSELESEGVKGLTGGPRMVILSTTGISDKGRDIPIAMIPMYHWVLSVPHADKKKLEDMMISGEGKNRKWVLIRPSFLADGPAKGLQDIRVSVEIPGAKREDVAIGYTIRREDVGEWIVESCVKGEEGKWDGKIVTLTY
jgi:nucleoside-diphosphate-sugar epimerase